MRMCEFAHARPLVNRMPSQKTRRFIHLRCWGCINDYHTGTPAELAQAVLQDFWVEFEETRRSVYRSFKVDHYGDYSRGRWVWFLEDIRPLNPPIPAKGRQGWFDVDLEEIC